MATAIDGRLCGVFLSLGFPPHTAFYYWHIKKVKGGTIEYVIGGASQMVRYWTVTHAAIVSGIEVDSLIALGRAGQFEMHPQTLEIDPESFTRWREQRHVQEKADMLERITEQYVQLYAQMGHMRHQIASLEHHVRLNSGKEYSLKLL